MLSIVLMVCQCGSVRRAGGLHVSELTFTSLDAKQAHAKSAKERDERVLTCHDTSVESELEVKLAIAGTVHRLSLSSLLSARRS